MKQVKLSSNTKREWFSALVRWTTPFFIRLLHYQLSFFGKAFARVQLPALLGASQATLMLRDALGRVVRMVTVFSPATGLVHELSLTGLNSRLYILHVQAGETMTACRLIID